MLCSSSMHFNVAHIERIDVRSVQYLIEDGSLCSYMRPSHSAKSISHFCGSKSLHEIDGLRVCFRRVICVCAKNDAFDRIVVGFGILQSFKYYRSNSISSAIAVCTIIKCIAVARV